MMGLENILVIGLGSIRITGLLLVMPIIGVSRFSPSLKFFLAMGMSLAMQSLYPISLDAILAQSDFFFIIIAKELFLGVVMGFTLRISFLVVSLAMEYAGMQMGFSIAMFFDPQTNTQISILAQLGTILVVLLFFVLNLHLDAFKALVLSYKVIPIFQLDYPYYKIFEQVVYFFKSAFILSLRLAMPVVIIMITIQLVLSIISKTAPQMNLFFNVSFIINLIIGVLIIYVTLPYIAKFYQNFNMDLFKHGYGIW